MVDDNDPFLIISARVRRKLADKHSVVPAEISQCFLNYTENNFLEDSREKTKQTHQQSGSYLKLIQDDC